MGPGFGGINLGGFALPDLNMDEINAGIASQLGPEIAKFLVEQELANATNEYEKDVAETKIEQINEFESGLGSLPPVVEEVMQTLSLPDEYKTIEAVSDRDFPRFAEPSAPMPSSIQETVKAALDKAIEEAPITPVETIAETPAPTTSFPSFSADITIDDLLGVNEQTTTPPPTFNAPVFTEEELGQGLRGLYDFIDIDELPDIDLKDFVRTNPGMPGFLDDTQDIVEAPSLPYDPNQPPGEFSKPIRMPAPPTIQKPVASPISNLIQQQRAQYNSALQNAVYNPQPQQQQTYFRPMSAAEFGSRPGQEPSTDLGFMSMMRGGALNSGLGGLPPMQQNDKLTQLFAQSFRPRR